MQKYVISISRQFGSLGRPIAKKLAELLEIEYYDRDIVEEASKVHNIPLKEASNLEESAKYLFMSFPLGMDTKAAKRMIRDVDKARDAYHMRYAGYLPNDMNHMDLMVNSATLGVDMTARLLAEVVRDKFS